MRYRIRITGRGTAEVTAYGIADAEHALEKELARAAPQASLKIREVRRMDRKSSVVEDFRITYELVTEVDVDAADELSARTAAYAAARRPLADTRFAWIAWDPKVVSLSAPHPNGLPPKPIADSR